MDSPEIWNRVAQQENDGNIDLIDREVREKAPAGVKGAYDAAASQAIAALRGFNTWLNGTLKQHQSDWRLGRTCTRKNSGSRLRMEKRRNRLFPAPFRNCSSFAGECAVRR